MERFHRTLNSLIGKVVSNNQKDWDVLLHTVLAAYRASVHSSTRFSNNRIILGKEVSRPLDIVMGLPLEEVRFISEYTTGVMEREAELHYTYDYVRKELKRCDNRRNCYYDALVRQSNFAVGDLVWYYYQDWSQERVKSSVHFII